MYSAEVLECPLLTKILFEEIAFDENTEYLDSHLSSQIGQSSNLYN